MAVWSRVDSVQLDPGWILAPERYHPLRMGASQEGVPLSQLANRTDLPARERAWAYLLKAEVHQRLGHEARAVVTLDRLLKIRRHHADAELHYRVARLQMAHRQHSQAFSEANLASFYAPNHSRYAALLERARAANDRSHEALDELLRSTQANPRSELVRRALNKILRKISRICRELAQPLPGCPRM